jgi:tetratricopeptide (TPR) repeat protein
VPSAQTSNSKPPSFAVSPLLCRGAGAFRLIHRSAASVCQAVVFFGAGIPSHMLIRRSVLLVRACANWYSIDLARHIKQVPPVRGSSLPLNPQVNIFSVREQDDDQSLRKSAKGSDTDGLAHMNDLDEAARWYERGLAAHAKSVACLCNYGTLQLYRNYPAKALKYFARAIHIEPYNAKVLTAFAAVLDDVGTGLPVVERMYIRALQQEPDYVMALNGLGTVYHRLQRYAEAQAYYKRALEIDATNTDVAVNLEILHEATFAHQSVADRSAADRSLLRSREKALGMPLRSRSRVEGSNLGPRASSRAGLLSRGSARSRLSSRDGPSYLQDRPSSRDLSSLALATSHSQAGRMSRRATPLHETPAQALADELDIIVPDE